MKIKDYKCKCGSNDFFFMDKCNHKGIYCTDCGRWLKWADKDEQNLAMKQEPILDKVKQAREEIENLNLNDYGDNLYQFQAKCTEILDKLIESEDKE